LLAFNIPEILEEDLQAIYEEGVDYFPDNGELSQENQCPCEITALAFSLLEKCRFCCISATKQGVDSSTGGSIFKYKMFVFDSTQQSTEDDGWYCSQISYYDGIYKIPDWQFNAENTVKYLFVNYLEDSHFIYLKRTKPMTLEEFKFFEKVVLMV